MSADGVEVEVSTHSRLKAAGPPFIFFSSTRSVSTHSRLKAAGYISSATSIRVTFQHTAA